MTRTFTHGPAGPATWRKRLFVLGPLALAALATAATFALGADTGFAGPLWMAAIAWTVPASLAGALARGLRHGDWSAFGRHRFPEDGGELDEWSSRTGRYQYLADIEDRLRDDDHLR